MLRQIGPAAFVLVALIHAAACMPHGPVVDAGSKPAGVGGTIAGIVRESGGSPLTARKVTATNIATGAKYEASTAANGGYTIKVPSGKYRLAVELRAGEMLEKEPVDTEVNTSDLDPHRDFVVGIKVGSRL